MMAREKDFFGNFNVNASVQGFTALHYAALLNNIESLKVLMSYGADPHIKSVTGHRPIDLVTDVQTFELLVEYQKNVRFLIMNPYNLYALIPLVYQNTDTDNNNNNNLMLINYCYLIW